MSRKKKLKPKPYVESMSRKKHKLYLFSLLSLRLHNLMESTEFKTAWKAPKAVIRKKGKIKYHDR